MGSAPSKSKSESSKQPKRLRGKSFRQSAPAGRSAEATYSEAPIAQNPQQWSREPHPSHQSQQNQGLGQPARPTIDNQKLQEQHQLYIQHLEQQQQQQSVVPEDETIDYSPMNNYNRQNINVGRHQPVNTTLIESSSNTTSSSTSKGRFTKSKSLTKNKPNRDAQSTPRSSVSGNRPSFSLLRSVGAGRKSSQLQRPGERDSTSNHEPLQISAPILEPESFHASMMDGNDAIWTDDQRYMVDASRGVRSPDAPRPSRDFYAKGSAPSPPRASADDANYRPVTQGNIRRRPEPHEPQSKFAVGSPRSGAYKAPAPPLPSEPKDGSSFAPTVTATTDANQSLQATWRENNSSNLPPIMSSPVISSSEARAQGTKPFSASSSQQQQQQQQESLAQDAIGSDQSGNDDSASRQARASPATASIGTSSSSRSKRNGLHEDWLQASLTGSHHRRPFNFQERLLQQPATDDASVISLAGSRIIQRDGSNTEDSSVRSSMRSGLIAGDEESHPSESEDRVSALADAPAYPVLVQQQQAPSRPQSMVDEDFRRLSQQPQPVIQPKNALRWSQDSSLLLQSETVNNLSGGTPPRSPARRHYRSSGLSATTTASSSSPRNSIMSSLQSPISSRASPRTSQEPPPKLPAGVMSHEFQVRQHAALGSILGSKYRAPIDTQVLGAVLDVGCGSGQWMREMAEEFPLTIIHGVDLLVPARRRRVPRGARVTPTGTSSTSRTDQHTSVQSASSAGSWTYSSPVLGSTKTMSSAPVDETLCPPSILDTMPNNCFFHKADVTQGLPFPDNTFDYCHVRLVLWGYRLNSFPGLLNELLRVTKPNGWIEFVDMDPCLRMPSELGTRLNEWIKTGLIHSNMDPDLVRALPEHLNEHCERSRRKVEAMLASHQQVASSAPESSSSPLRTGANARDGRNSIGNNCYGFSHLKVSKVAVPIGTWGGRKGEIWLESYADFLRCLEPMMIDAALSGLVMDRLHKREQRRLSAHNVLENQQQQQRPSASSPSEDHSQQHQQRQLEDLRASTEKTWRDMIDQLIQEATPNNNVSTNDFGAFGSWSRDAPRPHTEFCLAQAQKVNLVDQQQQKLMKELVTECLTPTLGSGPLGQLEDDTNGAVDCHAALQYHEHQRLHHLRHLNSIDGASNGADVMSPRPVPGGVFRPSPPTIPLPPVDAAPARSAQSASSGGSPAVVAPINGPSVAPPAASIAALAIRSSSRASHRESTPTPPPESQPPTSNSGMPASVEQRSMSRSSSMGSLVARSPSSTVPLSRRVGSPRLHSPSSIGSGQGPNGTTTTTTTKLSQYAHLGLKGFTPDYFNQFPPNVPLPPVPTSPIPPVPVAAPGSTPPPIGHPAKRKATLLPNAAATTSTAALAPIPPPPPAVAAPVSPALPSGPAPGLVTIQHTSAVTTTMDTHSNTNGGITSRDMTTINASSFPAPPGQKVKGQQQQQQQEHDSVENHAGANEEILIALSDELTDDDDDTDNHHHRRSRIAQPQRTTQEKELPRALSPDVEAEGEEIQMLLVDDEVEPHHVPESMDLPSTDHYSIAKGPEQVPGSVEEEPSQTAVAATPSPATTVVNGAQANVGTSTKRGAALIVDTTQANMYYSGEQAPTTIETPATTVTPATPFSDAPSYLTKDSAAGTDGDE